MIHNEIIYKGSFYFSWFSAYSASINWLKMFQKRLTGDMGYRSPHLSHAKRALYHLSYIPSYNLLLIFENLIFKHILQHQTKKPLENSSYTLYNHTKLYLISFWETCLYLKHKETLKNINNYISIRQFIKIYIKYFLLFLEIFFEIFKLDILLLYNCNSAKF
jgi:hypothetical protein